MVRMISLSALLLVGSAGCALLETKQPGQTAPPALQAARPLLVQPQDISAANAKAKLQQLQEEMDREAEILDRDLD